MRDEIKTMNFDQIEARMAEIKDAVATADGAQLEAFNAEVKELEERKAQIKAENEQRRKDIMDIVKGAGKQIEKIEERSKDEVVNSEAYINAYAEYIKTGDDRECRSLLTTDAGGVVPVPAIVDETVRTAWERDEIVNRVKKTYIRANLRVPFERSATGASVHNEGSSAPSEEELIIGIVEMIPKNIKKWITISDEAVTKGGEALLRYVYSEITYQIVKKLADLIVYDITHTGTSASSSAPAAAKITKAPSLTVIGEAYANLSDEATDPVVIMNKLTKTNFDAARAAGNFAIDPFEDMPVLYNNTLPAYDSASANDVYAIVGDLKGEQVNFPEGDNVLIKWDDLSLAERDLVKVVGREYVAHAVTASGRFCNIAKPSGTS